MQVKVKTLLNQTQPIPGFCYADVRLVERRGMPALRVHIEAHAQRPGRCSICEQPAPTYDHLQRRSWRHVAPWRIPMTFFYLWQPYLAVVRKHLRHAVQILDRFHLTALLNKAVDQVRRRESYALRGCAPGKRLKKTRWLLLRPRARVRGKARERLEVLLHSKLRTARA